MRSHRLGLPIMLQVTKDALDVDSNSGPLAAAIPEVVSDVFNIKSPASDLERRATTTDLLGQRHDRYIQRHQGVPVFSGELSVHFG
ncbi:MAG: hypothetical protein KDA33_14965, partial [Phycisphaerales bacterium]|nr:hypothetical protein [Phycisphaerales bacterium]